MARVFGHISGVPVGATFPNRMALYIAGVHRHDQKGIVGGEKEGAEAIVASGGYPDDQDFGDYIVYTGEGGNDRAKKKQIAHQVLKGGNLALAHSSIEGLPVRVIRGVGGDPAHSPASGYRYDGIYYVEDYASTTGQDGFTIWQFRLRAEDSADITEMPASPQGQGPAPRVHTDVQRIVRSTLIAQGVKTLHKHRCQVCGTTLDTPGGPYAEGAHIRPLGSPHDGPDHASNILCLCPNDHVRLDYGRSQSRTISKCWTLRPRMSAPFISPRGTRLTCRASGTTASTVEGCRG